MTDTLQSVATLVPAPLLCVPGVQDSVAERDAAGVVGAGAGSLTVIVALATAVPEPETVAKANVEKPTKKAASVVRIGRETKGRRAAATLQTERYDWSDSLQR